MRDWHADKTKNCIECVYSYDLHEIGADGRPFLCRCSNTSNENKRSRFLKKDGCDLYKPKNRRR